MDSVKRIYVYGKEFYIVVSWNALWNTSYNKNGIWRTKVKDKKLFEFLNFGIRVYSDLYVIWAEFETAKPASGPI